MLSCKKITIILLLVLSLVGLTFGHDYTIPGGTGPDGSQPDGEGGGDGDPLKNPSEGADPVLLHNGEMIVKAPRITIPGRMAGIEIVLTYRSFCEHNSAFGYGWGMNYDTKVIKIHSEQKKIVVDGHNRRLEYEVIPDSPPEVLVAYRCLLISTNMHDNLDGTSSIEKKHGERWKFDIDGKLTSIEDRLGNQLTFEYDAGGLLPLSGFPKYRAIIQEVPQPTTIALKPRLTRITNDLGQQVSFAYNQHGRVQSITDYAGRSWTFEYDSETDDLLSITEPATTQYPSGLTTYYTYDENHRLTSITDPKGNQYLVNAYDGSGRVESQTSGNHDYQFQYLTSDTTRLIDRKGYQADTTYNATGNPTQETVYTTGLRTDDPTQYTTVKEYDSKMNLTKIIYPAGNSTEFTYDDDDNLLEICRKRSSGDPYDEPNNIITIFTYEPNFDYLKTYTDPKGNTTTYTYDYEDVGYGTEVGNLMKITYSEVNGQIPEVHYTYNSTGQILTKTSVDGIVTKYEYYDAADLDGHGRLKRIIVDYGTNPENRNITSEFKYDNLGNIVEKTDALGNITQLSYDEYGHLLQAIAPAPFNYVTNFSYDQNGNVLQTDIQTDIPATPWQSTSYAYDSLDNVTGITNPLDLVTTIAYDNNENQHLVTDAENNASTYEYDERDLLWKETDAQGNTTEYAYDLNGNLEEIIDAKGNVTIYQYDEFDRLLTVTYPDLSIEEYEYDKNSNIIVKTNRAGQTTTFEYDALNRLTTKTLPDAPQITYDYDLAGRLETLTQGTQITSYQYDRIGRLTQVKYPDSKIVAYQYDNLDRRTKLTYPDTTFVTYHYDQLSRLTDIKDQVGSTIVHYDYDALSRRASMSYANGASASYEYDLNNRLTLLVNDANSWSQSFAYSYDNVGNRLNMTVNSTNIHDYMYDDIYQLTNVQYPDLNAYIYNYDALGNRDSVVNGGITDYVSNNLNQYTSVGGVSFSYDDNGNLTGDGINTYAYNSQNQLISAATPSHTISYEYDAVGKRISKTVDGQKTVYVYDGPQVIAELNDSGTLLRKYVYGPKIDEPVVMVSGSDKYFYLSDALGSITALADKAGNVVEQYEYDIFGTPSQISTVDNPYYFTARRYDENAELYYLRNRYYYPSLGRFLQIDPLGYIDGMNNYAYCNNNSVNWYDPYGLEKNNDNIEDITEDEFQDIMDEIREQLEDIDPYKPFQLDLHDYMKWDSDFYNDRNRDKLFNHDDRIGKGSDLNYYAIGMLFKHRGWSLKDAKNMATIWKRTNQWFFQRNKGYKDPSKNELYYLERGYNEYKRPPKNRNRHQSSDTRLHHSNYLGNTVDDAVNNIIETYSGI